MSRFRMLQVWMATMGLCTGLAVVPKLVAVGTKTFTGKVSDAMCGAKHSEGNLTPAACVRACVQKGAKYALVVGDKVYTLRTSDQAALDEQVVPQFETEAVPANTTGWLGNKARVTGTASEDTIPVEVRDSRRQVEPEDSWLYAQDYSKTTI